jgi:uncharacterized protein (TIGR03437 family)
MTKFATRLPLLFVITAVMAVTAQAQAPTIASDGVRNGASYTIAGLPNSGIAQGSIFVIFGDNLGPANIVQVSAFPLPTAAGLAGTSVRVTVGGNTQNAIMLYTLKTQVAAVLPSNTPLGTGTVTVTYNGQTSNAAPITVLAGSFGTFTRNQGGTGPSIIQNFNSQGDEPFNTLLDSARPGQIVTLWGTGLGPVSGNEAGQPLPGNMGNVNVRVFVSGREATIDYRGRSGCCVGIDQIVFRVPSGVSGCHAPVTVQVGDIVSNFTSMSIADNGGVCNDPGGFSVSDLERARANGGLRIGGVSMVRSETQLNVPGASGTFVIESGAGSFFRLSLDQLLSQSGTANPFNPGSCTVSVERVGAGASPPPAQITGLNAGPSISVNGPAGSRAMFPQQGFVGIYSANPPFSQSFPGQPAQPQFLVPGAYTSTGTGGADVGPFTANLTIPPGTTWANQASVSVVTRSAGQLVTWTGGDPNGFTYIAGGSVNAANTASATFVCFERTSAGQFTIPSSVLLALPASGTQVGFSLGTLIVGTITTPSFFTASGLDIGSSTYISTVSKAVDYR